MMNSSFFKECLVYLPHISNAPQRMRLRLKQNINIDELLFQVDRQCAIFNRLPFTLDENNEIDSCESILKECTLTSEYYSVFVLNDYEHAFMPIECVNDEVLRTCTTLLIKRKPDLANTSTSNEAEVKKSNEKIAFTAPNEQEALQKLESNYVEEIVGNKFFENELERGQESAQNNDLTWSTTKMMLFIVERICTNYAIDALENSKLQRIEETEWQTLVRYAMLKANKEFDLEKAEMGVTDLVNGVDYRVLRAFKQAIVGSMANAQRFREQKEEPQDANENSSSYYVNGKQ